MRIYYIFGVPFADTLFHYISGGTTFGRFTDNELWHHQIKGAHWGVRRFQNEDGSLTAAGRQRYDVGAPLGTKVTEYTDTGSSGGRSGSGRVHTYSTNTRVSSGNNSNWATVASKKAADARSASRKTFEKVLEKANAARGMQIKSNANAGKNAADKLFNTLSNNATKELLPAPAPVEEFDNSNSSQPRLSTQSINNDEIEKKLRPEPVEEEEGNIFNKAGDWLNKAGRDISNTATKAYDDTIGKAANYVGNGGLARDVGDNASKVGDWFKNAGRDISNTATGLPNNIKNWYTGENHATNAENFMKKQDEYTNRADQIYEQVRDQLVRPSNEEDFQDGLRKRQSAMLIDDQARNFGSQANDELGKYWNSPRQLLNSAGEWIGDRAGEVGGAARTAGEWIGDRAGEVGEAARNVIAQPAFDKAYENYMNKIAPYQEKMKEAQLNGDVATYNAMQNYINSAHANYRNELNRIASNPVGASVQNAGNSVMDWFRSFRR